MNKIITICLVLVLSLPISVWAVDSAVNADELEPVVETVVETVEQDSVILEENSNEENVVVQQSEESQYKQPISKRKLAKKFLLGMGAVLASSLILFFGLTIYNRIRESLLNRVKTPEGEVSLQTPDDVKNAVKTFLDKTKWEI